MNITLEEAIEKFNAWRKDTRKYIGEKIPNELWEIVKALLPTHGHQILCKNLGINKRQLKQYNLISENANDSALMDSFVMASVTTTPLVYELILQKEGKSLTLKLPASQLPHCLSLMVDSL